MTGADSRRGAAVADELRRAMGAGIESGVLTMSHLQELEDEARRWETTQAPPERIAECLGAAAKARQAFQAGSDTVGSVVAELIRLLGRSQDVSEESVPVQTPREIAKYHLQDAHRDRRVACAHAVGAIAASAASVAAGIWGVTIASHVPGKYPPSALLFPGLLVVGALMALLLMVRGARTSIIASREQTRIARAIVGLPSYLGPLPEPAQYFMRAKLAPIIFPRLIEDDDPVRSVQWPGDEDIIRTISGYANDETGAESLTNSDSSPDDSQPAV